MPVLELKNIIKKYPDGQNINEVLKDVSFQVNQGEFAAIVGPSGAGKSTLLTIMGALLTPTSGQILLNGQDISQLSKKKQTEIRLNQIGFIFQNSDLIPYLKIKDQLQFIQKISSKKPVDAIGILDNWVSSHVSIVIQTFYLVVKSKESQSPEPSSINRT